MYQKHQQPVKLEDVESDLDAEEERVPRINIRAHVIYENPQKRLTATRKRNVALHVKCFAVHHDSKF